MKKKTLITIGMIIFSILLLGSAVHAYTINQDLKPINEPFDIGSQIEGEGKDAASGTILILNILAGALLYFAAPIAIILIAFAGVDLIMGGADSEKVTQAKKNLTWTLIGLGLIILSYSIVRILIEWISGAGNR